MVSRVLGRGGLPILEIAPLVWRGLVETALTPINTPTLSFTSKFPEEGLDGDVSFAPPVLGKQKEPLAKLSL